MAKVELTFTLSDELDENGQYTCQIQSEETKNLEYNAEYDPSESCVPELLSFILRELCNREDLLYEVSERIISDVKARMDEKDEAGEHEQTENGDVS